MRGLRRVPLLFLALIAVFSALPAFAVEEGLSGESLKCLLCHGRQGMTMEFEDGETIGTTVDPRSFQGSVHGFLSCSGCHTGFSGDTHPQRHFRSKKHYQVRAARICRRCHTDESIGAASVHAGLLKKEAGGETFICSDCHSAHSVTRVPGARFPSEVHHCMNCHGEDVSMSFKSGETMPLKTDLAGLAASVHHNLSCSDCHFGFSSEEHPRRNFKGRRDFSLASSEVCTRCHFDKYSKMLESIHYATLCQGDLTAPVCTDCHGSHSVSPVHMDRTESALKCKGCHGRIYETYAESVHGNALFNEANRDVPACIDCHRVHDIKSPLTVEYHERIPQMCSNCHMNSAIVEKYGLSTDVVKTYLSDFHGVTLEFYRTQEDAPYRPPRPIAVCTDCHGTHNITSTVGPGATTVKANLVKACRKCHEGASENFPDAWLSHYVPSLARAPVVYIVDKAYKIFLPFMVIGLILQILLHFWRFLVNR